eukprot:7145132-Pyramimonas_sp.AAC.1
MDRRMGRTDASSGSRSAWPRRASATFVAAVLRDLLVRTLTRELPHIGASALQDAALEEQLRIAFSVFDYEGKQEVSVEYFKQCMAKVSVTRAIASCELRDCAGSRKERIAPITTRQ